jgi:hypothetical protein
MYGLSDHGNGIPRTRLRAFRHGSSRYSTRIGPESIANICSLRPIEVTYTPAREVDDNLPSTYARPADGRARA